MSFLSALPDDAVVLDIFKLNKPAGVALTNFFTATMRSPSPLTEGQREMIAAYVSGLNSCQYCYGVHSITAEAFGLEEGVLAEMVDDIDSAAVDDKLKPILRLARRLTLEPAKVVQSDVDTVLAAGWDEQTVHDAINVVCVFNFMNRLLDGHGVKGSPTINESRGKGLHQGGYAPLLAALEG